MCSIFLPTKHFFAIMLYCTLQYTSLNLMSSTLLITLLPHSFSSGAVDVYVTGSHNGWKIMQLRILHHEWIVGIQVITIIHTQVFVMSLCTRSNELMLVDQCNGCLYVCVCAIADRQAGLNVPEKWCCWLSWTQCTWLLTWGSYCCDTGKHCHLSTVWYHLPRHSHQLPHVPVWCRWHGLQMVMILSEHSRLCELMPIILLMSLFVYQGHDTVRLVCPGCCSIQSLWVTSPTASGTTRCKVTVVSW